MILHSAILEHQLAALAALSAWKDQLSIEETQLLISQGLSLESPIPSPEVMQTLARFERKWSEINEAIQECEDAIGKGWEPCPVN